MTTKPLSPLRRLVRIVALSLIAVLAWPVLAETNAGQTYALHAGAPLLGKAIPALRVTDIDGHVIDLAAIRGKKAIYLKFWATWCVPCRQQMPHLENVQRHAGDDMVVVAINVGFDDSVEQIRAYRKELGLTMPIVRDDGSLAALFGLRVTPQHVVIGRDGRVAYVSHLADARLDQALADARHAPTATPAELARNVLPMPSVDNEGITVGQAVPAKALQSVDGTSLTLADPARRKETVVVFFSPWCEGYLATTRPEASRQCKHVREQMMALGKDPSLRWVAIASGLWANGDDLRAFRDKYHIAVPLVLDADGEWLGHFGVHRVPVMVLVGSDGKVRRLLTVDGEVAQSVPALLSAP